MYRAVAVAVGGLAAWLLGGAFTGIAGGGIADRVLYILFALAIGAYTPLAALGFGVVLVVTAAGALPVLLWLLPAFAGWGIRWVPHHPWVRQQWTALGYELRLQRWHRRQREQANVDPEQVFPVELGVRLVSWAAWLSVALPALCALVVVFRGTPLNTALVLGAGGLFSAVSWMSVACFHAITRYSRRNVLYSQVGCHIVSLVISAGPLGALLVHLTSFLGGNSGWLIVALGGAHLGVAWVLATQAVRHPLVEGVVGAFVGWFQGVPLYYAAAVFHPDHDTTFVAAGVAVAALPVLGHALIASQSPGWWVRRIDVRCFHPGARGDRRRVLRAWVNDAVVVRGADRPDLSVVHTLAAEGVATFRDKPGATSSPTSELGEVALSWVDVAVDVLGTAERAVSRLDNPMFLLARADCVLARARIHEALASWEAALAGYHEAADLLDAHGLPDLAATGRLHGARLLSAKLRQPHEALSELRALLDHVNLLAPTRRWSLNAAAAFADQPQAVELTSRAAQVRVRWRDVRRYWAQERAAGRACTPVRVLLFSTHLPAAPLPLTAPLRRLPTSPPPPRPRPSKFPDFGPDSEVKRLVKRGVRRWESGQVHRASADLDRAAELLEQNFQSIRALEVLIELARAQTEVDPLLGRRTLRRALDLQDRIRAEVADPDMHLSTSGWFEELYTQLISLLVLRGHDGDGRPKQPAVAAFDLVEQVRSRVLLELLGENLPLRADELRPELVEREQRLLTEVRARQKAFTGPINQVKTLVDLRRARESLAATWQSVAELGPPGAEYAQLRRGDPLSFAEIRALLNPNGAAVSAVLAEYHVTDQETLLFVIRADSAEPAVERIPLTRQRLRELVTSAFGGSAEDLRHSAPTNWGALLAALIEPIGRHCAEGEVLWLVPHDVLHYLPLHAVELDGRALVDRNPVCYTSSASVMRYCQAKRQPGRRRALILVDSRADQPLSHAREQGLAVAALFGDHARSFAGADATAAALKREIDPATLLVHIACHGRFNRDDPLRSGVLLAAGNGGDGLLTAERILQLSLPADLVTLSACESGMNDRRPGDELLGLTRALIYAGAAAVLVSLWAVDELSTSLLMHGFYEVWISGESKAEALRRAQLALRDATLTDVIAYCERVRRLREGRAARQVHTQLERDIADARFLARDFVAALDAYDALLDASDPSVSGHHDLMRAAARCRVALRSELAGNPDYTARIYAHPYYWAPFVLVGDWR